MFISFNLTIFINVQKEQTMSTLQAQQFQQIFPLDGDVVCHDLKTSNAILLDIEGFLKELDLDIQITRHKTYTAISGTGTISSECVVMVNNHGITQVNTYYRETETVSKTVTWKNLRRTLIMLINCA